MAEETIESLKICRECKLEQSLSEFYFIQSRNSYKCDCRKCYAVKRKETTKRYVENNREKIKARTNKFAAENRDKLRAYAKKHYAENREAGKEYRRERYKTYDRELELAKRKKWYQNNKERHAANREKYEQENKERLRAARRKWENERLAKDMEYKLHKNISGRIRFELNGKAKGSSRTEELIGCTISELRTFIENQFTEGMTWENWGTNGWHIDHRIPLTWFRLENENCRKIAFSYKNLQPLWGKENLEKKNFYAHKLAD